MAETKQRTRGGQFQKTEKAATSTGFGESKVFNAPDGTFEDPYAGLVLTLGGEPLTDAQRALIPFDLTDQGRAKKEQEIEERGGRAHVEVLREKIEFAGGTDAQGNYKPGSTIEVSSDEEGKQLLKFADLIKEGKQPWDVAGGDALADAKRQFEIPGTKIRLLGPDTIKHRGVRGFEPVINTKTGEPERVGRMIVGRMSEETAKKRNAYYAKQAHEQMVSSLDKVRDQQEQIASMNRMAKGARRHREELDNGMTRYRGDAQEMGDSDFAPSIQEGPVTI